MYIYIDIYIYMYIYMYVFDHNAFSEMLLVFF